MNYDNSFLRAVLRNFGKERRERVIADCAPVKHWPGLCMHRLWWYDVAEDIIWGFIHQKGDLDWHTVIIGASKHSEFCNNIRSIMSFECSSEHGSGCSSTE
jgi:hypothetical protein